MAGIGEKCLKQIWDLALNCFGLNVFSEQHYLEAFLEQLFKSCQTRHNDKNCQLNQKKSEIRKTKSTKLTRKDFELLSLFETSSEGELLGDNDLLA